MPHLIENSWRWLSHMEQSHSAHHSQMLPRNGTNKNFQLRSDDMYPEMNIYALVLNRYSEQASRVSRGQRAPFSLSLLWPGDAGTLLVGKRCSVGVFHVVEGTTPMLHLLHWVLTGIKPISVALFFFFFPTSFLCPVFPFFSYSQFAGEQPQQQLSFCLKALTLQLG